jgi:restriction endonuclease S subunit
MIGALPSLEGLQPNPDWAKLPLFDRTGWRTLPFGEFAQNINERVEPSDAAEDIYVGLEHLDPQNLHIRHWGKGSDVIGTKLRFRKGDIIFGRRRAYQRKLAVAEFDGICSAHAMVVRAKPEVVLPEFLPFLMMSDRFMNRAVEISVGSLSPTINWKTLKLEEFDLPPLDQQRRIAESLWAVDESLIKWVMIGETLENYTALLRKNILLQRHEFTAKARFACLSDIAEILMGQSPDGSSYNKEGVGLPLLNGPTEFGKVYPRELQYTNSPKKTCAPGDILFCVRGSTTGRQNLSDKVYCIGRGLAAIRGKDGRGVTSYLRIALQALAEDIFREAKGAGSTFPNITSERLGARQLPAPSVGIQHRIGLMFKELENLREEVDSHITKMHSLMFRIATTIAV